jgi:choline dehydrogenase-like flavoprotein
LRVKGMVNLRICDASSFATIPSAPTALACAGLGYGLSSMMFEETSGKKDQ